MRDFSACEGNPRSDGMVLWSHDCQPHPDSIQQMRRTSKPDWYKSPIFILIFVIRIKIQEFANNIKLHWENKARISKTVQLKHATRKTIQRCLPFSAQKWLCDIFSSYFAQFTVFSRIFYKTYFKNLFNKVIDTVLLTTVCSVFCSFCQKVATDRCLGVNESITQTTRYNTDLFHDHDFHQDVV